MYMNNQVHRALFRTEGEGKERERKKERNYINLKVRSPCANPVKLRREGGRDGGKKGSFLITCIVYHNLKERKKRTEKKERRITHYKIDNNLNGLEK